MAISGRDTSSEWTSVSSITAGPPAFCTWWSGGPRCPDCIETRTIDEGRVSPVLIGQSTEIWECSVRDDSEPPDGGAALRPSLPVIPSPLPCPVSSRQILPPYAAGKTSQ